MQPSTNSTVPPQPVLLPEGLLLRWAHTRTLIAVAGWCGMVLAVLLGLIGVVVALLCLDIPKGLAGGTALVFVAAVTFAQSLALVRQANAIRRAMNTRAVHDARQVLAHQIDYWKLACTWGAPALLLVVVLIVSFGRVSR